MKTQLLALHARTNRVGGIRSSITQRVPPLSNVQPSHDMERVSRTAMTSWAAGSNGTCHSIQSLPGTAG